MSSLAVSIIVPTYNRAHLLPRSLASALSQMLPGDELIVIDDESTDNTSEVLAGYGDRLRSYRIPNRGAGVARNFGVGKASCPLVAFLDSDDEWMPHKLALQRAVMAARPDVLFCFSDFAVTFKDHTVRRNNIRYWARDPRPWEQILGPALPFSGISPLPSGCSDFAVHIGDLALPELIQPRVLTSSLMVHRERAGNALWFAEDVPTYEDMECFARLSLEGNAAYLDTETAWQHGHAGERLTDLVGVAALDTHLKILERVYPGHQKFMARHGSAYETKRQALLRDKLATLLVQGRAIEARQTVRAMTGAPLSLRVLAGLPSPLVKVLLAMRRKLRG